MAGSTPVGVIGLGLMGQVYTRRLIAAGFSVVGYDVDAAKMKRMTELGARSGSLAGIARDCEPIVLAVFNTDQVENVVEHTLAPSAASKIVLCTSTCDPDRIATLGARVQGKLRFLETPVSGTSEQVNDGDGVGLIGGDEQVAAQAKPVLDALFPKRFHIGKVGDGSRTKLAVNLILGLNRMALAEGMVFAERVGLDLSAFLKVAQASAAYSQIMDTKGPKMIASDFSRQGYIKQHLKDVHLMLDQAQKIRQKLPLLEVHADALEACVRHGEGEADNCIIIEEIRRRVT